METAAIPVRVLLADDHPLIRAGLRSLLDRMDGVEVVGEAASGEELLGMTASHRPDIVVSDISMPGLTGLEAAARLAADWPGTRVIILSMHADEAHVVQALRAGVAGYVVKDAALVELEVALAAVARGELYLSPAVSRQVVERSLRPPAAPAPVELLTPRQVEVIRLIAAGRSTKEIARDLGISIKTVETHRQQLMERLDLHDVASLVRFALRTGLVTDE